MKKIFTVMIMLVAFVVYAEDKASTYELPH